MKSYPLSDEAAAQLAQWPADLRVLFDELIDDALSDFQRELLHRAVMAGHSPAEVHAFADAIRSLTDSEAFDACTLGDSIASDLTVAQVLRAELDPLEAFELQGGRIEPDEALERRFAQVRRPVTTNAEDASVAPAPKPPPLPPRRERPPPLAKQVQASIPATQPSSAFARALATHSAQLGLVWNEVNLEVSPGLSMRDGLAAAAEALERGIPVPAMIGPQAQEHRRSIVLLQMQTMGQGRAWQLYDPLTTELVWANEADLLAKTELPFADKSHRCLTRLMLPRTAQGSGAKSSWGNVR